MVDSPQAVRHARLAQLPDKPVIEEMQCSEREKYKGMNVICGKCLYRNFPAAPKNFIRLPSEIKGRLVLAWHRGANYAVLEIPITLESSGTGLEMP